jgi:hypothetical protein
LLKTGSATIASVGIGVGRVGWAMAVAAKTHPKSAAKVKRKPFAAPSHDAPSADFRQFDRGHNI